MAAQRDVVAELGLLLDRIPGEMSDYEQDADGNVLVPVDVWISANELAAHIGENWTKFPGADPYDEEGAAAARAAARLARVRLRELYKARDEWARRYAVAASGGDTGRTVQTSHGRAPRRPNVRTQRERARAPGSRSEDSDPDHDVVPVRGGGA